MDIDILSMCKTNGLWVRLSSRHVVCSKYSSRLRQTSLMLLILLARATNVWKCGRRRGAAAPAGHNKQFIGTKINDSRGGRETLPFNRESRESVAVDGYCIGLFKNFPLPSQRTR